MTTQAASRFNFSILLKVDASHSYVVQSPPMEIGAYLTEMFDIVAQANEFSEAGKEIPPDLKARMNGLTVPDAFKENQFRAVLGDAYDQMNADRMPTEVVKLATATVGVWIRADKETAEKYWNSGGRVPTKAPTDRKRKKNSSRAT